jgi:hypothetical protein
MASRQPLLAGEQPPGTWEAAFQPVWVASDPEGPVGPIQLGSTDGVIAVNTWVEVTGHFDDPAADECGPSGDGFREECAGTRS